MKKVKSPDNVAGRRDYMVKCVHPIAMRVEKGMPNSDGR